MKPIRKLLVIRLSALGDVCMTLPVLASACKAYPNIEFTFVTSKVGGIVYHSVLKAPNLKIRTINKKDYNGLFGLNRLYAELKSLQFDAVADCVPNGWISVSSWQASRLLRSIRVALRRRPWLHMPYIVN